MREFFAIDIGGTSIKYGIVNEIGEIIYSNSVNTDVSKGSEYIMETIIDIVNTMKLKNTHIKHLGISSAGVIDNEGIVLYAGYTIPNYTNTNIKNILEKATGMIVEVENDVNCALLGEKWIGSGSNCKDFVMITIGTGIGGAICIDDKLYKGINFCAGEVGYMKVRGEDFQLKASTKSLVDNVKCELNLTDLDGEQVFELEKTNRNVEKIVNDFYDCLAEGINNISCIINPEKIIIGGGIINNRNFESRLKSSFNKYTDDVRIKNELINIAKLGNNAGMIGSIVKFL